MIVKEIFVFNESIRYKNKALKRILDMLDMCSSIKDVERDMLRSVILDEVNSLYRNMMGQENGNEEN